MCHRALRANVGFQRSYAHKSNIIRLLNYYECQTNKMTKISPNELDIK